MREASAEKDLKRLMSNVIVQLESIERGYQAFSTAQLDLVKQYPQMVRDELQRYEDLLFQLFSVKRVTDDMMLAEEVAEEEEEEEEDRQSSRTSKLLFIFVCFVSRFW